MQGRSDRSGRFDGRARGPMIAGAVLLAVLLAVGISAPILASAGGAPELGGPIVVDPDRVSPRPSGETGRGTEGPGGARQVQPTTPCAAGTASSPPASSAPDDQDDIGETDDRDCDDLDDVVD